MPSFPQYDSALLKRLDAQTASILGVFAERSYSRVEPPILQPAELFLDRSGEEIRRRTFVLTDPGGQELCMRHTGMVSSGRKQSSCPPGSVSTKVRRRISSPERSRNNSAG